MHDLLSIDGKHIKPHRVVKRNVVLGNKVSGSITDLLLFGTRDRIQTSPVLFVLTIFYFNKNQIFLFFCNNINFCLPAAVIAGNDLISAFLQILCRKLFFSLPSCRLFNPIPHFYIFIRISRISSSATGLAYTSSPNVMTSPMPFWKTKRSLPSRTFLSVYNFFTSASRSI